MRVCIRTVGCRTNKADAQEMARCLREEGISLVDAPEDADRVVVFSCTVTLAADRDTRREAFRARRSARDPRVLVVGCLPSALGTGASWADPRTVLIADREEALQRLLEAGREPAGSPSVSAATAGPPAAARAYLKIQEGCNHRCTYCIVPAARGPARSVPASRVLERVEAAVQEGRRDLVLTGTHVGCWGLDLEPARDLAWLLELLGPRLGSGVRLRLGSLEPQDCSPAVLGLLAPPVCPSLHLPLQSGSDAVLRRMERPYSAADFQAVALEARRRVGPLLCLGTDVIAGFPGETEEDFAETLRALEAAGIHRLHAFSWSPRPGTPAAAMPGRLDPSTVRSRTQRLRRWGRESLARFAASMVGRELETFVEEPGGTEGAWSGLTENFLRAELRGPAAPGTWVRLRVEGARGGAVCGTIVGHEVRSHP